MSFKMIDNLYEEIRQKLNLNYELAVLLIPERLREEFKNSVITPEKLNEEFVPLIYKAKKFPVEEESDFIKCLIAARFDVQGFAAKLISRNIFPETICAELTRGIFDD